MKKFILILISTLMLFTLSSCGKNKTVSLDKKVNVTLNVNTTVSDYEVVANNGNVSKTGDNKYKVELDYINSVNISVSKDGYETVTLFIDSSELTDGDITKSVDFGEERKIRLFVNVFGYIENVKVYLNNKEITKTNNKFQALVSPKELNRLMVKSDNGSTYSCSFTNEERNKTIVNSNIFITETGTKAFRIENHRESQILSIDDQIFECINSPYEDNVSYLVLPKHFKGKLVLENNQIHNISGYEEIYYNEIEYRGSSQVCLDQNVKLYCEDNRNNFRELYYNEHDKSYGCDSNVVRLWYIDDANNYRYYDYNGERQLSINDFKIAKLSNDYYIYNLFGFTLTNQSFNYNGNYVTIRNGVLTLSDPSETYINLPNNYGSISLYKRDVKNPFNGIIYKNDVLYNKADFYKSVTFTYKLTQNNEYLRPKETGSGRIERGYILNDWYLYGKIVIKDYNDKYHIAHLGPEYDRNDYSSTYDGLERYVEVKDTFAARVNMEQASIQSIVINGKTYRSNIYYEFDINTTYNIKVNYFNYNDSKGTEYTKEINIDFSKYKIDELNNLVSHQQIYIK